MPVEFSERHARKVRLADDCDPTTLRLSPTEGYLLSRIDGQTTWGELRQMGALPPDAVDACIEDWAKEGVVVIDGTGGMERSKAAEAPKRVRSNGAIGDLPSLDEGLDLSLEIQEELLAFAGLLDKPYHEVLGVSKDADAREIKKAYFGLSKRFHPDRYFRRNTGAFEGLIETCFKRLLEAYELLSDPNTRAEVQRTEAAAPASAPSEAVGKPKKPLTSIEARKRLRQRVGQLSGHKRVVQDRKRKAKSFFEAGMTAFREERWLEASGSVRLAIAFDPDNQAYRESFADVQRKAHEERSKVLLKQANGAYEMRDLKDAYKLFNDAVHFRPFDAELAHRTANLAFSVENDLKRAKELAQQAVELEPDVGEYRRTLAQIFEEAGMDANARREYEAALRIDPKDKEAKAGLRKL